MNHVASDTDLHLIRASPHPCLPLIVSRELPDCFFDQTRRIVAEWHAKALFSVTVGGCHDDLKLEQKGALGWLCIHFPIDTL